MVVNANAPTEVPCSLRVQDLASRCMATDPDMRPTFAEIQTELGDFESENDDPITGGHHGNGSVNPEL